MTDEDLDFAVQVICTNLSDIEPEAQHPIFNPETCGFREIGHIGIIACIFPFDEAVFITHCEWNDGEETEYTTAYKISEIEKFDPPIFIEETPLAKAIKLVQITRE